ncbi:histone-lysine N-methyltransferase ASHR1-like isoform X2 [Hermetia illucens]|uniref:histone-lysine N-methyltransferase ASHR1-like isoform X2 n=1 Tax=Hermetia illucens TaxID=343691 RepID=UPI0018CC1B8E|nr:histone-lysine N-methyltransferase ASHR1-like isoform X2 [Hermetia illucens]
MFEILKSDTMGRYLTAVKLIKPGELIINEMPLVIGPPMHNSPFCLGCNQKVDFSSEQYRCPGCRWPLCGPDCKGINNEIGHSKQECSILTERNIINSIEKSHGNRLKAIHEVIFHLRCLYLKHSHKDKWEKLQALEAHNDLRKDIPMLWYRNQFRIVNQIREDWNITDFSEEEIHTVCGIIKVNCFGVGREGIRGRSLYPTTSLLAHDCSPNARIILDSNDYSVSVSASRDIKEGEIITISYVDIFMSTLQRRDELKNAKFFWCSCQRCSDPTEFDTFCNALRCPKCSKSSVLPTDPLDQKAPWRCTNCSHIMDADVVAAILVLLPEELGTFDINDVASHKKFIESKILGDNHYFLLSAKYAICQAKCSNSTPTSFLENKEKYCREILKVMELLVPGQSRVKGIIMFELYFTLMLLSAKKMQTDQITKKEFRNTMRNAIGLLEESEEILRWEPEGTASRKKAEEAKAILLQLKCDRP